MIAYGRLLVDHPDRIGDVEALGLDEVLFARQVNRPAFHGHSDVPWVSGRPPFVGPAVMRVPVGVAGPRTRSG